MKPTLKAPGSKRLKLEHEKLLSNFAFNFNLRRYTEVAPPAPSPAPAPAPAPAAAPVAAGVVSRPLDVSAAAGSLKSGAAVFGATGSGVATWQQPQLDAPPAALAASPVAADVVSRPLDISAAAGSLKSGSAVFGATGSGVATWQVGAGSPQVDPELTALGFSA